MPLLRDNADSLLQQFWVISKMQKQFLSILPKCMTQPKIFFRHFRCPQGVVVTQEKKFEKSQPVSHFWTNFAKILQNFKIS